MQLFAGLRGTWRCIFENVNHQTFAVSRRPLVTGTRPLSLTERPSRLLLGSLFVIALLAFELFNFDTTRFALHDLLGDEQVLGLGWATVLAIAFCTIDFAGLLRIFLPDERRQVPTELWYLMGAWLLGATLNAIMTWWAVSLALLNRPLGNEVLDREKLLLVVPIFVACLVWLTRILFIGSLSLTSSYLFAGQPQAKPSGLPQREYRTTSPTPLPELTSVTDELPPFLAKEPLFTREFPHSQTAVQPSRSPSTRSKRQQSSHSV